MRWSFAGVVGDARGKGRQAALSGADGSTVGVCVPGGKPGPAVFRRSAGTVPPASKRSYWASTPGSMRTRAARRTLWGRSRPTPGDCMTSRERMGVVPGLLHGSLLFRVADGRSDRPHGRRAATFRGGCAETAGKLPLGVPQSSTAGSGAVGSASASPPCWRTRRLAADDEPSAIGSQFSTARKPPPLAVVFLARRWPSIPKAMVPAPPRAAGSNQFHRHEAGAHSAGRGSTWARRRN